MLPQAGFEHHNIQDVNDKLVTAGCYSKFKIIHSLSPKLIKAISGMEDKHSTCTTPSR